MKALRLICLAAGFLAAGIAISAVAHNEVPLYVGGALFGVFLACAFVSDHLEGRGG